jgi:hypothetical protein
VLLDENDDGEEDGRALRAALSKVLLVFGLVPEENDEVLLLEVLPAE